MSDSITFANFKEFQRSIKRLRKNKGDQIDECLIKSKTDDYHQELLEVNLFKRNVAKYPTNTFQDEIYNMTLQAFSK